MKATDVRNLYADHFNPVLLTAFVAAALVGCGGGSSSTPVTQPSQPVQVTRLEQYRPQLSFSPLQNWTNDPTGLVYYDGEYHLFYQYNPDGTGWGNMSWGHAVSTDLAHWTELPIALNALEHTDSNGNPIQMYFTGSAVVDYNNTTGFGTTTNPPMVAIYTNFYPNALTLANGQTVQAGTQAQSISYSLDHGRTWTQYAGNPVIPLPPAPNQDQYQNFRDPKVFWYAPGKKWVMIAVLSSLHEAVLFSSPDLKNWTYMSTFGPANAIGGVWECPDLYQLPVDGKATNTKWVLSINLNPGAVAGGSGGQYFTGQFDGTTFTPDAGQVYDSTPPAGTVFQDFEGASYAAIGWKTTGDFVGASPAAGNAPGQGGVGGFLGSHELDTFTAAKGDGATGTLTSPTFTISSPYINLLVGGGCHPHNPNTTTAALPVGTLLFPGADFEIPAGAKSSTYESLGWIATGDFKGQNVATAALPGQSLVSGIQGQGFEDSFMGELLDPPVNGDVAEGTLTSPTFTISKNYINFLIGGGYHPYGVDPNPTAVVLLVNGKVVESATGHNEEALNWANWDVSQYVGQQAQIQIIDQNSGGWGHVNADQFLAADAPAFPAPEETTVNLFVDGNLVQSDTGSNSEVLSWHTWDVAGYAGHQAYIQVIDDNSGGWGHISVDQITFSAQPKNVANWVNYGSDYYAGVTWNGSADGNTYALAWMSNWDYAGSEPTSPWQNAQTFARQYQLKTVNNQVRLVQQPVAAFSQLRMPDPITYTNTALKSGVTPTSISTITDPVEIQVQFAPGTSTEFGVNVHTSASGEQTVVGYDVASSQVYIDRSNSGITSFNPTFADRHYAPLPLSNGLVNLHIYVDTSSVNVFAGTGEIVLTDLIFPSAGSDGVSLFSNGGSATVSSLSAWSLTSIWDGQ